MGEREQDAESRESELKDEELKLREEEQDKINKKMSAEEVAAKAKQIAQRMRALAQASEQVRRCVRAGVHMRWCLAGYAELGCSFSHTCMYAQERMHMNTWIPHGSCMYVSGCLHESAMLSGMAHSCFSV